MAKIRKDDTVFVTSGKEKGKQGKVREVFPKDNRIIIEGINMVVRHQKPKGVGRTGGIINKEAPLDVSNVMLLCTQCGKPTRVGFQISADGTKTRQCKQCGKEID